MVTSITNRTVSLVEKLPWGVGALRVVRRSLRSSLFLNLSSATGTAIAQELIGLFVMRLFELPDARFRPDCGSGHDSQQGALFTCHL